MHEILCLTANAFTLLKPFGICIGNFMCHMHESEGAITLMSKFHVVTPGSESRMMDTPSLSASA